MPKKVEIRPGTKFGQWTVLYETDKRAMTGNKLYRCKCSCGRESDVRGDKLISGTSTSCGKCSASSLQRILSNNLSKTNTSGRKGVRWNEKDGRWEAAITFNGERQYLGQYTDKQDAIQAREAAEHLLERKYEFKRSD